MSDPAQGLSVADIEARIVADLTPEERDSVVVYIDQVVHPGGADLFLADERYEVEHPTAVVFLDEEPGVNWGHRCAYVLIDMATGAARRIDARFPPSLTDVPGTFQIAWRPPHVDSWALWSEE